MDQSYLAREVERFAGVAMTPFEVGEWTAAPVGVAKDGAREVSTVRRAASRPIADCNDRKGCDF